MSFPLGRQVPEAQGIYTPIHRGPFHFIHATHLEPREKDLGFTLDFEEICMVSSLDTLSVN